MRLRTAILGCGGFAQRHAQVLSGLAADIELVAFADRNPEKAQAFCDQFAPQARVFTHHRGLLEQTDLDLLVIALPPYGHTDEVELAAKKGVHIFIEKPIALESEQAWAMVRVCEAAGIKTQVGFMSRFGEAVEQFKQRLESGEAGAIGMFSARYFCNALHAPWWRMREKSGGQLVEQAIHLFDVLRYLMGQPQRVYSRQTNFFHQGVPDYTSEDTSATILTFQNGALGVVQATNGAVPGRWLSEFQVVAQHLTGEFASPNQAKLHFTSRPEAVPLLIDSLADVFVKQMRDLIGAIGSGSPTRTPMREGALSLDLVLAARRSAEEGQEVVLGV